MTTDKSSATGPAKKAAARTRAPSKAAATEAPEKPIPRTRRKAVSTTNGAVEALDARPVGDSQPTIADVEAEVRVRAYLLSLARGDGPGSPDADWYQAEREIALVRQS